MYGKVTSIKTISYIWTSAEESLKVCMSNGIYRLSHMEELTFEPKHSTIFGIPIERVHLCNRVIEHLNQKRAENLKETSIFVLKSHIIVVH